MVWSQSAKFQFPWDNLSLCLQNVGAMQVTLFSERNALEKYLSLSNSTNREETPSVLQFQKDFLLCRFFASPFLLPSQSSNSMA